MRPELCPHSSHQGPGEAERGSECVSIQHAPPPPHRQAARDCLSRDIEGTAMGSSEEWLGVPSHLSLGNDRTF